jgi:hypothetical protein
MHCLPYLAAASGWGQVDTSPLIHGGCYHLTEGGRLYGLRDSCWRLSFTIMQTLWNCFRYTYYFKDRHVLKVKDLSITMFWLNMYSFWHLWSVVELLEKFRKLWLALRIQSMLICHWNIKIFWWVTAFQGEELQERKESTWGSCCCNRTFVWVSDISSSIHSMYASSAILSFWFLIFKQKVNGASLLFTCCCTSSFVFLYSVSH